MDKLYWEILDEERNKILPIFFIFKDDFYLAGGTALALQIGHRDSIDFDFFTAKSFSSQELFIKLKEAFIGLEMIKVQEEKDTLSILIDEKIKVSFFGFPYDLVEPLIKTEYLNLASVEDIGAMKLSAITGRSVLKDYVDLYWILQKIDLLKLIKVTQKKFKELDINLVLKSLVYFEDVIEEPIIYKNYGEVSFEEIKGYLRKTVNNYLS